MKYIIFYNNGNTHNYANSRNDLLKLLELLKSETITDIRKIYKSGVSDSVLEKYIKYQGEIIMIKFTTNRKKMEFWLTVTQVINMVKSWDNLITDGADTGIFITPTVILWIDPLHETVDVEETIINTNNEMETITLEIEHMSMKEVNDFLEWEQTLYEYCKKCKCQIGGSSTLLPIFFNKQK